MIDYTCDVACDPKESSFKFMSRNYKNGPRHFYKTIRGVLSGAAECSVHPPGHCETLAEPGDVDLVVSGMPCQPFTRFRPKHENMSGRKGPARTHPQAHVAMEEMPEYLIRVRPTAFILEEVAGFKDKIDKSDPNSETFLDVFTNRIAAHGQFSESNV
jgi:site-specific DNA-cytosine methylase